MRRRRTPMENIERFMERDDGMPLIEQRILWEEYQRLKKEVDTAHQVIKDCAEEHGAGPVCRRLEEQVDQLKNVIVQLRVQLGWSTNGDWRYTSTME